MVPPEGEDTRPKPGFWLMAAVFGLFLFGASAPSPLYAVYAALWHFSPLTLTLVFAVYALALLVALLLAGSLSDAVGRRPVILGAIALQAVAMLLFAIADGAAWLYAARILQGLATGVVTSAVAAAIFDLQPPAAPRLAPFVNSATPGIGLSLGAVVSGLLVQYGPGPLILIYALMMVALFIAFGLVWLMAEPHPRSGAVNLRPRVGVPPAARRSFLAALPCLVTVWALGGFYLSLGPSVVLNISGSHNHLLGGVAILALAGSGVVASFFVGASTPRRAMIVGIACLVAGLAGTVVAIALSSVVVFFATTVIAGMGFGVAFLGVFRTLSALAPPESRGALIAAVYVISYLAFSLPAVAAGFTATLVGLHLTAIAFGASLGILALAGLLATALTGDDRTATGREPAQR